MMASRSSFILTYILTISTYYSAATHTFIRNHSVIEDCKIVTQCRDNGTKTDDFTVSDFDTGVVKVILPGSFERQLTLYSSLYGETCEYEEPGFEYSIYNCEMPSENFSSECSYQEVTFRYLFTSCYAVSNGNITLATGYVQTNYTDQSLKEDCSFKVDVDLVQEKYALISVNITPFLLNSVLTFFLNDTFCIYAPQMDEFWWKVEIKEYLSDDVIIEKNETQNRTVDCVLVMNDEIGIRQLRCEIDWTDISCIVVTRENSNNPIMFPPCPEVTHIPIGPLQPYNSTEHYYPAENVSRTTNILFLMFIPLTAVLFCICLRLYYSNPKDESNEEGQYTFETPHSLKCKVLFLYPQDCDSFMAIMKNLQKFLDGFNYFEVYDYFDPKRFGEIACDPQGWISRLLSQEDVRIILAETDTAVLHQLAIAKKCVVNYYSPLPYSYLFTYGLQNLLQSLRPQEYSRIFLIRFEDITQEKENLKLSRYQRYKLPEHLRNLISCMSNCTKILFKEAEESTEMQRLKHSIDKFRKFQENNPNYHEKLCNKLTKLV